MSLPIDHCLAWGCDMRTQRDGSRRCARPWCGIVATPAPTIWRCVCGAPMVLGGESCRACQPEARS